MSLVYTIEFIILQRNRGIVTQLLKQGINIKQCVLTTYSNLETQNLIYCSSI